MKKKSENEELEKKKIKGFILSKKKIGARVKEGIHSLKYFQRIEEVEEKIRNLIKELKIAEIHRR